MKICPKCGYVGNEGWQPSRYRAEVEILRVDTFKELYPNLQFENNLAIDGYYAYLLRKSGMVERVWIGLFKAGGKSAFGIPREKYYGWKLANPNQKKLTDIV